MNLYAKLQQRAAEGQTGPRRPDRRRQVRLDVPAQVPRTPGVHLVGIADLSPEGARANLARVGWQAERAQAASLDAAIKAGTTHVGDDWQALVRHPAIDIIVECTGHPIAAVDHCLEAFGTASTSST
jgi:predicted homoserine dehydrogenase-like protein